MRAHNSQVLSIYVSKDIEMIVRYISLKGTHDFLASNGSQYSISRGDWDSPPISFKLVPGQEFQLTVKSIESVKLEYTNYLGLGHEGKLCQNWTEYDYYECKRNFIKHAMHSPDFAKMYCKNLDNFGNCTVPQVRNAYLLSSTCSIWVVYNV